MTTAIATIYEKPDLNPLRILCIALPDSETHQTFLGLSEQLTFVPHQVESLAHAVTLLSCKTFDVVWLDAAIVLKNNVGDISDIRRLHDKWLIGVTCAPGAEQEISLLQQGVDICIRCDDAPSLVTAKIIALTNRFRIMAQPKECLDTTPVELRKACMEQNGVLLMDEGRKRVLLENQPVLLSNSEFELFRIFMKHRGHVLNRDFLHVQLFGNEWDGLDRAVDQRVVRLRKKIGDSPENPRWIMSVRGIGYKMNICDSVAENISKSLPPLTKSDCDSLR